MVVPVIIFKMHVSYIVANPKKKVFAGKAEVAMTPKISGLIQELNDLYVLAGAAETVGCKKVLLFLFLFSKQCPVRWILFCEYLLEFDEYLFALIVERKDFPALLNSSHGIETSVKQLDDGVLELRFDSLFVDDDQFLANIAEP